MNEPDRRIQSFELAYEMAHAAKPHRDLALYALEAGNTETHDLALGRADRASILAGKNFLAELNTSLDYYDTGEELELESKKFEIDLGPSVPTTELDLRQFASSSDIASHSEKLGSRLWTAFVYGGRTYSTIFPSQFIYAGDGRQLLKLNLTQQLVDESRQFWNMGVKTHALLEEYFRANQPESPEALDIPK